MESAFDTLTQTVVGAIIVLLVGAVIWLARKLSEVQEARVTDAKKVFEDGLKREERWQNILVELTNQVERLSMPTGRPRG